MAVCIQFEIETLKFVCIWIKLSLRGFFAKALCGDVHLQ